MMHIVAAALHRRVVLRGPMEKQELRWHGKCVELGLEARQHHPQDRQEDQKPEQPSRARRYPYASRSYLSCPRLRLQISPDDSDPEEGYDIDDDNRDPSPGRGVCDRELDQHMRV